MTINHKSIKLIGLEELSWFTYNSGYSRNCINPNKYLIRQLIKLICYQASL